MTRSRRSSPSPRQLLDDLAAARAPEPRASFVSDLESRLATLIEASATGDLVPEIELAPPARSRAVPPATMTILTASLCAVLLAVGFGAIRTAGVARSEVATGGRGDFTAAAARADGATSAADGDVDVIAGLEDHVSPSPSSTPGAGEGGARRGRRLASSAPASSSTTSRPDAPGERAPTSAASAEHTATSEGAAAHTGAGEPSSFGLKASGTAARVFLQWERYERDDFAAYLVLRANSPDTPQQPDPSGRTLMLLRIENRDMTTHQDTPKVGTTPRYRVVVVRKDGTVVAQSGVVSPAMPLAPASNDVQTIYPAIS